jgi:hypothetical protein
MIDRSAFLGMDHLKWIFLDHSQIEDISYCFTDIPSSRLFILLWRKSSTNRLFKLLNLGNCVNTLYEMLKRDRLGLDLNVSWCTYTSLFPFKSRFFNIPNHSNACASIRLILLFESNSVSKLWISIKV